MDSGEIASIGAVIGLVLSTLGVTGVDSGMISAAVNGVISIVAVGCALWSWYSHRAKNTQ